MLKEIAKPAALRKEVSEGVFSLPSAYQPQQRCEKEEVVKGEFAVLSKMVTFDASPLKSVACEKDRGGTRPGSGRGLILFVIILLSLLMFRFYHYC